MLDHACDSAIDQADQPLNVWAMIERCALHTMQGRQGRRAEVMALVVSGAWKLWPENARVRWEDCIASRGVACTKHSLCNIQTLVTWFTDFVGCQLC